MKYKRIYTVLLSFIFFLLPLLVLAINNDTEVKGSDCNILPMEIIDVYYPFGAKYKIPENDVTSKYLKKAYSFEKSGSLNQAYRYYSYAYQRVRNTPQAPYILFKRAYTITDERTFIKELKNILKEYPNFPLIDAVEFEISSYLYLKNHLDEAMKFIDSIIQRDDSPFFPYALTLKAGIYYKEKAYERSINYFFKSISKLKRIISGSGINEQQLMTNYIGLAKCYLEENNYKESEVILRKVYGTTTINNIKEKALFYLFYLYKYMNEDDLAKVCYFKLNRQFPNSIFFLKIKKEYNYDNMELTNSRAGENIAVQDKSILKGVDSIDKLVMLKVKTKIRNGDSLQTENNDNVKNGFSVQVGSFKTRKNSEKMLEKISKYGYPVYTENTKIDDTQIFRVRVGPFSTRDKALKVFQELEKYSIKGYVVKGR